MLYSVVLHGRAHAVISTLTSDFSSLPAFKYSVSNIYFTNYLKRYRLSSFVRYYVYVHLFRTGCYSITACICGSRKSFRSLATPVFTVLHEMQTVKTGAARQTTDGHCNNCKNTYYNLSCNPRVTQLQSVKLRIKRLLCYVMLRTDRQTSAGGTDRQTDCNIALCT